MFRYIPLFFSILILFTVSVKGQCPISISPNTPACAGTQIDLSTPINPDTSVSYTWDLGFGPTQSGPTATISYPNNNGQTDYPITLTVITSTDTCVSLDTITVLYTPDVYICGNL
ncbi:MAG: PKD domain-containing protein, partial [Bacteroidetes bacterium]|nr:PKD domain-containing protein [Bacteroidota bacterium]